MKSSTLVLSIAGLFAIGLSAPRSVQAQNSETAEIKNTPIRLNTDGATLYSVLKTLFGQVKVDFTIVDTLKTIPVTVQINQPFRIAFSSVLKAAGKPIFYRVEDGVYHISESNGDDAASIIESPAEETLSPPKRRTQMHVLKVRNGSGLEVAALLGANFVPWIAGFYPPYVATNPFAPTMMSGAGFGGLGNNGGGGAAMGLANGFSGMFALPGLGVGWFGDAPNDNAGNNGNGGR